MVFSSVKKSLYNEKKSLKFPVTVKDAHIACSQGVNNLT